MTLQPGAILNNRYRIVKLLAQGGFGTLYRAWDTTLGRPCAIKENQDAAPEIQRQFLREAKILANLNHPNLPRVTDYFIQNQDQYLVMDYVEGQDLQEMLDQRGSPLSEDQVLPWIKQVCDALSYLHSQKPPIIHRDIKPANIKITPAGQAMLVDFGIAKTYTPHTKTTVGAQAVTAGYSPYEQYGKGTTDARSDIYALGATFYTLLTGQEPPESIQRVVRDPLLPARQLNPAISLRVSSALMRALQMDALQRFQNAADFKLALCPPQAALHSRAPSPQRFNSPAFSPPAGPGAVSAPAPGHGWVGWRALAALAIGLLSLLVLVLLVITINNRNTHRPAAILETSGLPALTVSPPSDSPLTASPEPTLKSTGTLSPTSTPLVYVVQIGDTCSEIAQQFGVSTRDIAALNGLPSDCGIIYAGQKLLLPASAHLAVEVITPTSSSTPPQPLATQVSDIDGMVMVYVPSSPFKMGSADIDADASDEEKPQHIVHLRAYWIDRYEVTNAMYARCVRGGACIPPEKFSSKTYVAYYNEPGYENYPVIYVSWNDAQTYCTWAGRRLPSEAEWEKAARGVDGQIYPWGDQTPAANLANFGGQVGDTSRVGSYPDGASPYGVLDMAGNVAEWVADWYGEDYYAESAYSNPTGPQSGEFRVLRGGSWFNMARTMRSAFRLWNYPGVRTDTIGFRCAK